MKILLFILSIFGFKVLFLLLVFFFFDFFMKGIGFKFTKENTTEVGVRVGTIVYDEKNDQALFTKNAEHYPEYYCSGTLKAVG